MGSYHKYLIRFLKTHNFNESHKGDEYPDQVVSRGKPATKLEEMRHKKDTQILSKWNDTDFKLYAKTKQRINCNELKGEEQQQTVDFFLLFITRIAL